MLLARVQSPLSPLYEPLGYTLGFKGPARYWFNIRGDIRGFYTFELQTTGFLLDLLPDADHWRAVFPGERRSRIDTLKAAAYFMRACRERGEYQPDSDLTIAVESVVPMEPKAIAGPVESDT